MHILSLGYGNWFMGIRVYLFIYLYICIDKVVDCYAWVFVYAYTLKEYPERKRISFKNQFIALPVT